MKVTRQQARKTSAKRKAASCISSAIDELTRGGCGNLAQRLRAWAEVCELQGSSANCAGAIEERVRVKLDWDAPDNMWRWKTSTEVLLEIGMNKPTRTDASKAGVIIRNLNGHRSRRNNGRNQSFVPPKFEGMPNGAKASVRDPGPLFAFVNIRQ